MIIGIVGSVDSFVANDDIHEKTLERNLKHNHFSLSKKNVLQWKKMEKATLLQRKQSLPGSRRPLFHLLNNQQSASNPFTAHEQLSNIHNQEGHSFG